MSLLEKLFFIYALFFFVVAFFIKYLSFSTFLALKKTTLIASIFSFTKAQFLFVAFCMKNTLHLSKFTENWPFFFFYAFTKQTAKTTYFIAIVGFLQLLPRC